MSNPYASIANFRSHWGAARTASLVDGSATVQDDVIQTALDASASQIEAAAEEGGFVVPIVVADIEDAAARQVQLANLLRMKTVVIATYFYLQPIDATPQVQRVQTVCERWLKGLEDGKGLGVQPPAGDGDLTWIPMTGASDDLTQQNLQRARRVDF